MKCGVMITAHKRRFPLKTDQASTSMEGNDENATDTGKSACPRGFRAFNANSDVVHLACDQWKCDVCRTVLSWRCAQDVWYGINLWDGNSYHWTLTLSGKVKSSAFAFRILRNLWDNLRKSMQRSMGHWYYAAFVELHPNREGIAHFHVVSTAKAPKRLKDLAHQCGFGYEAVEELIEGKEAAFYVSKYTSKQGAVMPKGFRRVRFSQVWPRLPDPLYEVPVYPMHQGEGVSDYLRRMALLLETDPRILQERWLDKTNDI